MQIYNKASERQTAKTVEHNNPLQKGAISVGHKGIDKP